MRTLEAVSAMIILCLACSGPCPKSKSCRYTRWQFRTERWLGDLDFANKGRMYSQRQEACLCLVEI